MSFRFALWCPQGRAGLPLAARLLLGQLDRAQVVWRSDEAMPTGPGAMVVDLWLVLCVDVPPVPPPWKTETNGQWAVLPGTAAVWTEATLAALRAWSPCHWLSDLMPDETRNPHLRTAWSEGAVVWLPAWNSLETRRSPGRSLVVESSADFEALLPLEPIRQFALASAVPEKSGANSRDRVLVCSADPVFSGAASRSAAERGADAILLGTPGSAMRRWLLGGNEACVLPLMEGPDRLRPSFGILQKVLRQSPKAEVEAVPVPALSMGDWAAVVIDPERVPADGGGRAAQLVQRDRELRADPRHARVAELAARLAPELGLDYFPSAGMGESVFARLAGLEGATEAAELTVGLEGILPGWVDKARRWGVQHASSNLARRLWHGVCDGYRERRTGDAFAAACEIMAATGPVEQLPAAALSLRLVLAATAGDWAVADDVVRVLSERDRSALVPALLDILRAWLPGLESGEGASVPPGGPEWWLRQIARCVAERLPSAGAIAAYGKLWMDSPAAALAQLAQAEPSLLETASFVVLACVRRAPVEAAEVWAPNVATPLPDDLSVRLTALCAKALCEPPQPELLSEKRRRDAKSPGIYARTYPSHHRCFFSALIHQRWGDPAEAAEWRRRAEAEDNMAARRAWLFASH